MMQKRLDLSQESVALSSEQLRLCNASELRDLEGPAASADLRRVDPRHCGWCRRQEKVESRAWVRRMVSNEECARQCFGYEQLRR